LGGDWSGSSSFSFFSNRLSSGSGSATTPGIAQECRAR
jgi:hypothetical protein